MRDDYTLRVDVGVGCNINAVDINVVGRTILVPNVQMKQ